MRPEDLYAFTRRLPFVPWRLFTTDGRTYDIRHPDQVIVMRSRVIVGIVDNGVADRVEHLSLLHIVRIEELQPDPSRSSE